ncbi:MAG: acetylglutamate kinase [Tannerella sp.]|jgi:acetylglutamate kinase|nr:acetylglutamate kinase [Tannerella sp.]
METLTIVKAGGKIVEDDNALNSLLADFTLIEGYKILVHGGGRSATKLSEQLGIESRMIDGRRITDAEMLKIVTMVYAGWVNKTIVARLQAQHVNAVGLTGADMNVIRAVKRPVETIDYGFVGDVKEVNASLLTMLLKQHVVPVLSPLTHDGKGLLLNTNADTIAFETAKALSKAFDVTLIYCFEKSGVLRNEQDETSVIPCIDKALFQRYKTEGVIRGGMIPKLENAILAIDAGVKKVLITNASEINGNKGTLIRQNINLLAE